MEQSSADGAHAAPPAHSASGDGRGGAAAPRLEQRTLLDTGRYRVTLRDYGEGLGEVGWSFVPASRPAQAARGLSKRREENEDRAVRRARSRLRQLVMSIQADHLLTLTYRENVSEFSQASGDLARFVRVVRRESHGWRYVAVPERQKRGAWHWHLAVCGRQDVTLLRSAWRHVVGEGNIDVAPPRVPRAQRMLALVRYLGKYMAKGFEEADHDFNGRRFRASVGIVVPSKSLDVPVASTSVITAFACGELARAAGRVGFVWTAEDKSAGWACSWGR